MRLIDTAEMYGDWRGGRDRRRSDPRTTPIGVFVITKVYPHNASRTELPKACDRSLKRLLIDAIDLYLLHWRERTPPLQETVDAFEKLRAAGRDKTLGRLKPSTSMTWRNCCRPRRRSQMCRKSGSVQSPESRNRVRSLAVEPNEQDPDHGVFACRSQRPVAQKPNAKENRAIP